MPVPPAQRVVYARDPLAEVIVQLRFPAILKIGTVAGAGDLARFQDEVRGEYPLVLEPKMQLVPGVSLELLQSVGVAVNHAHEFVSADELHKVSLVRAALSLSTLSYTRWEAFRKQIQAVLQAFGDVYRPAFFERIGLRYRNQIVRSTLGLGDEPWGSLLEPLVAGPFLSEPLAADVGYFHAETQIKLERGDKATLRFGLPLVVTGEPTFIIDNDLFAESKTEVSDALQVLDRLHAASGPIFRGCIRERLHLAMEPGAVE